MELIVCSSVPSGTVPNLVLLQNEFLLALPTVLVCPLRAGMKLTALRVEIPWSGEILIACPELARPIRRSVLRHLGRLNAQLSRDIMDRLRMLLAE